MAKNRSNEEKSAITAASGMMSAVWLDLLSAVRERGGSGEDLYRLNTPEGKSIIGKLADVIVANNGKQAVPISHNYVTYPVPVNLTRTLAEMVSAGKYDYANPNIVEKNFPIQRPSASEVAVEGGDPYRTPGIQNSDSTKLVLVHLNKVATTTEVLEHMDKLGLRPARIEELLALGEKYPDLQRQFPIVALGSVWVLSGGRRFVAYLARGGSRRGLVLGWVGPGCTWGELCRFVAVSK
jgi:hypothetical protein